MPPAPGFTLHDFFVASLKYGVGAGIAVFLVFKLAGSFDAKLDAVGAQLHELGNRDAIQVLLLQAICYNTATTESERAVCREAGR